MEDVRTEELEQQLLLRAGQLEGQKPDPALFQNYDAFHNAQQKWNEDAATLLFLAYEIRDSLYEKAGGEKD